jgi:hypothetical protein
MARLRALQFNTDWWAGGEYASWKFIHFHSTYANTPTLSAKYAGCEPKQHDRQLTKESNGVQGVLLLKLDRSSE